MPSTGPGTVGVGPGNQVRQAICWRRGGRYQPGNARVSQPSPVSVAGQPDYFGRFGKGGFYPGSVKGIHVTFVALIETLLPGNGRYILKGRDRSAIIGSQ